MEAWGQTYAHSWEGICVCSLCHTFYSFTSVLCGVITFMNTEFSRGRDITSSWNCCDCVVSVMFALSDGLYGGWIKAHSAESFSKLYPPDRVSGPLLSERRQDAIGYRRCVLRINRRKWPLLSERLQDAIGYRRRVLRINRRKGPLLSERRQDAIGYRRRVLRINRRNSHRT